MSKKSKAKTRSKRKRSGAPGRKPARYSRISAVLLAAFLFAFAVLLLFSYRDAPRMVLPTHSGRMRLYLGSVAAASILCGVWLLLGGMSVDRKLGRLSGRLGDEIREVGEKIRVEVSNTPAAILAVLGAATLLAIWLRFRYLAQPMRYDEAYTYNSYGRFPLAVSLSAYDSPNNHFFNTLLLHLSTSLFGNHEWSVRLPAFLFGVLVVPAIYAASRLFAGRGASLIASGAAASWPVLVEYSANGRGYTAVAFFFVASLASARLLLEKDRLLFRIGLAAFTIGILYTTPAGIYAAATCWGWFLASAFAQRDGKGIRWREGVGLGAVVAAILGALYAFPLAVGGFGAVLERDDIRPLGLSEYLRRAPDNLVEIGRFVLRAVPLPVAIAVAGAAVAAIPAVFGTSRLRPRLAGLPAAGLLAAFLVTALQMQWPYTRTWIFGVPLLLITSATGLEAIGSLAAGKARRLDKTKTYLSATAAALLAALMAFALVTSSTIETSPDTGYAPDAREATRFLEDKVRPGDTVLARVPADAPLIYYFMRAGLGIDYFKPHQPVKVFVYVEKESQSVESILEFYRIRPAEDSGPEKIWEGKTGAVYELAKFTTG